MVEEEEEEKSTFRVPPLYFLLTSSTLCIMYTDGENRLELNNNFFLSFYYSEIEHYWQREREKVWNP